MQADETSGQKDRPVLATTAAGHVFPPRLQETKKARLRMKKKWKNVSSVSAEFHA